MGFDSKSTTHHVYWPNKVKVNMECNVRFECDHGLMLEMPMTTDPPLVTPTTPIPNTTGSETGLEPTDPLEGLESPEPTPLEGHGARSNGHLHMHATY